MKVLLVQPPNHSNLGLQGLMLLEPLGLEMIGASLQSEHQVDILDMRLEPSLRRKLAQFKPDAVGVASSFTADVYNVFHVLDIVKEYNPHIFSFVGGQHATMAHADFIGRKADAVVLGEGELTVRELLDCWEHYRPLKEVSGLAFRHDGSWITNTPRRLIQDLDEVPLPARSLVSKYLPNYHLIWQQPGALVETTRGCPHRCKFCSVWKFWRGSLRSRSPERIVEDLSQIECEDVLFTDDSALSNPACSENIVDAIQKAGLRKRYIMQVRADSIVNCRDLLSRWKDVGLDCVFVGFESIKQQELDNYGKRLTVDCCEEAINILHELGLSFTGSFIISPDFEKEDFAALRCFVRKHMKMSMPTFPILTPLPGTVLYKERAAEIISDNYELYDLLHSILPTRLGLNKFYKQCVRLHTSYYYVYITPIGFKKALSRGNLRGFLNQALKAISMLLNNHPWALVKHHKLPPGQLSMNGFPKQARRI